MNMRKTNEDLLLCAIICSLTGLFTGHQSRFGQVTKREEPLGIADGRCFTDWTTLT